MNRTLVNNIKRKNAPCRQKPIFDRVGFIIDFESGALSEEETIAGFQNLINDGSVWQLQGCYGRTAARLIEAGLCTK
jgi:hypothetical protein